MHKTYELAFEIESDFAMFARPDCGAAPVSYPVPTPSALRGVFESIFRMHDAIFIPDEVWICKPIRFYDYGFNYGGRYRKDNQIANGAAMQVKASVLFDVRYVVKGHTSVRHRRVSANTNSAHALRDGFERFLRLGKCRRVPCLGWSEFLVRSIKAFDAKASDAKPIDSINMTIKSMLANVFGAEWASDPNPQFLHDAKIERGVLKFGLVT